MIIDKFFEMCYNKYTTVHLHHPVEKQNYGQITKKFLDACVSANSRIFIWILWGVYMYELKVKAAFDSAHFLSGYSGKCANIHGHRWIVEAEISQKELQKNGEFRGMVEDFGPLKRRLRDMADYFDHALIYESGTLRPLTVEILNNEGFRLVSVNFRPTAECFAKYFYELLCDSGEPVSKVTVYETPDICASYRSDE